VEHSVVRRVRRISCVCVACIGFLLVGCSPTTRTADTESDTTAARPVSPTSTDLEELERLVRAQPDDAKAQARYGSALVEAGEVGKGIAHLRKAVTLTPDLTAAWHNLGLAAERQGWLDISAEAYGKVVAAKPDHAGEWIKLGYALIALGRYAEAERAFERAAQLRPSSSESLVALASSYYAHFQFTEALDALKRAAKINPNSAAAYVNMASIHLERNALTEAEEAIRNARKIAPDTPQYDLLLGKVLAQSTLPAKRAEAKEHLNKALSCQEESGGQALTAPEEAEAIYQLGIIVRNTGDSKQAITLWRRALTLDPIRPEIQQVLGRALIKRGGTATGEGRRLIAEYARLQKVRDQERELRQRVEAHPQDGEARLLYGKTLLEQGNLPRATWELQEAVRLRPNDKAARQTLAEALRKQGRDAEANGL
jgi:cytochrome c-type biogenesis protein CcmH/NrfG